MPDKQTLKDAIKEALFEYDEYKEERKKKALPKMVSKNQAVELELITRGKLEKLILSGRLTVKKTGSTRTSTIYVLTKELLDFKELII